MPKGPRPRSARSPLALYARTLREARGLTQDELADLGKVHVSTVKNIEGDRDVGVETLGHLYRDSLRGKHAVAPAEWHQLLGYWLLARFPGGISARDVLGGIHAVEATAAQNLDARARALITAASKLNVADAATLLTIAQAGATKRGRAIFNHLRTMLELQ